MSAGTDVKITDEIVAQHGLAPDEYKRAIEILGRTPNLLELGIFSVMWSEHCSYKSSKKWLRKLPTKAPWVIHGPGENAGVVDIGGGLTAIFKMESHNHPSFIEPYQGAATGVGGILRDVFTMGARPVALLNALRFGDPDHPRTRHLLSGVVSGIGGYGNCVGVPTVGGECEFDPAYNGNILVNAMAVGIAPADKIFTAAAAGEGNPIVYVGSRTGRDGIHGATMASAAFDEDSQSQRPTVQVGDPFVEKLLIEACLELMATDAILAIQDMGAAGLTSSSFEMADKGGSGVELDLDQVPMRETGMTPYELMLSESQERMLMVLRPGQEHVAQAIFDKWGLACVTIGRLTSSGRMVLRWHGETVGDLPIKPLADGSPEYDRPTEPTPPPAKLEIEDVPARLDPSSVLRQMMGSPHLSSRRWIWEQYDWSVMGDTVDAPGSDAAVVRIHGTSRGLALTSDCTPRYCVADPVQGGRQAVAEAWRNLTATGAKPLALTDNMNFGNPERPRIMGQFAGCIEGMREACDALDFPVVSGNVSLYNESDGASIMPTPTIGGLGLIKDVAKATGVALPGGDLTIILIGHTEGHLGASRYLNIIEGRTDGAPPPVDLKAERANGDLVRELIQEELALACHDVADGGLYVALAEMALAGNVGVSVEVPPDAPPIHAWLFGEDQGRYLIATDRADRVMTLAGMKGVPARRIGFTGGHSLTVNGDYTISLDELRDAHEGWMPAYMAAS